MRLGESVTYPLERSDEGGLDTILALSFRTVSRGTRFTRGLAKNDCDACIIALICTNSMSFEINQPAYQ